MKERSATTAPIILGIDPGTHVTGYGVIALIHKKPTMLTCGAIRTNAKEELGKRYLQIFNEIESLIQEYSPTMISVESQFVDKNVQSALKLGMAKGIILLAGAKNNIPLFEYAPRKVKIAVTGRGNASKEQIQSMVKLLLKMDNPPTPHDAADALALALCHAHAL